MFNFCSTVGNAVVMIEVSAAESKVMTQRVKMITQNPGPWAGRTAGLSIVRAAMSACPSPVRAMDNLFEDGSIALLSRRVFVSIEISLPGSWYSRQRRGGRIALPVQNL
jgi:hypothetical protein